MVAISLAFFLAGFLVVRPSTPPLLPYIDQNICPGEGCQYGTWTALGETTVYTDWGAAGRCAGTIHKGERVIAITGLVATLRPGKIVLTRDLPGKKLLQGDVLLTFTYLGEGNAVTWIGGHLASSYDISFARHEDGSGCGGGNCAGIFSDEGEHVWWAEIRLQTGRLGWVNMEESNFDGTCAFGLRLNTSSSRHFHGNSSLLNR